MVWRAGKSTLLRQVCLAALMAQVGAWVPAESLEMTPVDAIFVRMGARDAIMSGQVSRCGPVLHELLEHHGSPSKQLRHLLQRFIAHLPSDSMKRVNAF